MILVIRISGIVHVNADIEEALSRIRLRRKYSAVLLKPTTDNLSLLKKIRNHVAYGDIDHETLVKLIEKRGQIKDKKIKLESKKIAEQLEHKTLEDLGLKPSFRLHPPIGGIESKKHSGVGKGVLGDNKKKINELVRRML